MRFSTVRNKVTRRDILLISEELLLISYYEHESFGVFLHLYGLDGAFLERRRRRRRCRLTVAVIAVVVVMVVVAVGVQWSVWEIYYPSDDGITGLTLLPKIARILKFVLFGTEKDQRWDLPSRLELSTSAVRSGGRSTSRP